MEGSVIESIQVHLIKKKIYSKHNCLVVLMLMTLYKRNVCKGIIVPKTNGLMQVNSAIGLVFLWSDLAMRTIPDAPDKNMK